MSYPPPDLGGYPAPPPYAASPIPSPTARRGGLAVAALVLGILAVLTSPSIVGGLLFGIVAAILGFVAVGKANRGEAGRRGMAWVGVILGAVGIVLAGLVTAFVVWVWGAADVGEYLDCVNAAPNRAAEQICSDQLDDRLTDIFG